MKRVASAARFVILALAACNGDLPPATSTANSSGGAPAAGASGTASAAGSGGGAAGAGGAPTDAGVAPSAGSGGRAAAGSGGAGAGLPPVCHLNDNPEWDPNDADGGVDPTCMNIPVKIIQERCIGSPCHHNGRFQQPAGGLDLMSPCIADRLVDVTSRCMDLKLIDPAAPEQSFLWDKLSAETPKCGESMPFTGHLPPEQVRCMQAWITAISREANLTP